MNTERLVKRLEIFVGSVRLQNSQSKCYQKILNDMASYSQTTELKGRF